MNIDNICPKDGATMLPSKAIKNTLVGFDDFGGDAGQPGSTVSRSGPAIMVDCIKCPKCGFTRETE